MFTTIVYNVCIVTYYTLYWTFVVLVYVLDLLKYPLHPYMLALIAVAFCAYKLYKYRVSGLSAFGANKKQTKGIDVVFHTETLDGHAAAWALGEGALVPKDTKPPARFYYEVTNVATISKIAPVDKLRGKTIVFVDVHPPVEELVKICTEAAKVLIFSSTDVDTMTDKKLEHPLLNGVLSYYIDRTKTGSMIAWEYAHKGERLPTILSYVADIVQRKFGLAKSQEIASYLNHNVKLYTFAEIANKKLASVDDIKKYYEMLDTTTTAATKTMAAGQQSSYDSYQYTYGDYMYTSSPVQPPPQPQKPKRPRLEQSLYHFVKMAEEGKKYVNINNDIALKHDYIEKQIKICNTVYTAFLTTSIDSFAEPVGTHLLTSVKDDAVNTFVAVACYNILTGQCKLYVYTKAFDVADIMDHLGAITGSIRCETTHFATANFAGALPSWFKKSCA